MSKMKSKLKSKPENIWGFNTVGKAVHNAITLFYHFPLEERNAKTLQTSLLESWFSEVMWNKKPPLGAWGGFKTREEENISYKEGLSMLQIFYRIADKNFKIAFLPTKDIKHSIDDYKGLIRPLNDSYDISGKFDLIVEENDGSLHIIDFKTGKKEDNDNSQLRFYKLLAELNFNKPVSKASFYYLRTGIPRPFDLETEDVEDIKKEVISKIETIKNAKEFPTRPSGLCKFCIYKHFCPDNKQVSKILEKSSGVDIPDDLPF